MGANQYVYVVDYQGSGVKQGMNQHINVIVLLKIQMLKACANRRPKVSR